MAFLVSAIWHALGGKRGLERPGLDVAVTALVATVGDEFWARHGENGVTSDAFLEALVACKDRVCGPEFRWAATGASAVSCRGAHLVAQQRGTLCGEAGERRRRSLRMESGHPEEGRGHLPVSCLSTPRMHNRRRW